jgi:hypothetical protein
MRFCRESPATHSTSSVFSYLPRFAIRVSAAGLLRHRRVELYHMSSKRKSPLAAFGEFAPVDTCTRCVGGMRTPECIASRYDTSSGTTSRHCIRV